MQHKLQLIPWPKLITQVGGAFVWKPGDRLMLAPESGAGDLEVLEVLADELARCGVLRPGVDKTASGQVQRRGLRLRYAGKNKYAPEGYSIHVTPAGVETEAATAAGMFYAVQTLRQIARCVGATWPGLCIEDEPRLSYRGLSVSVSQGVMPRPDLLRQWVPRLAEFKLNVFQLYTDCGFKFASHPTLSADMVRYTPEDILALDELCARHHIDLQPSFNSFGHAGSLLANPRYRHLAESKSRGSFCPTDPRTYEFLAELYADYLPLFRSKFLNVGCDEVADMGMGRSRRAAQRLGLPGLFASHIKRLQKLAARHGKRIQIWGDMVRWMPEILDLLPRDVIILNWVYDDEQQDEFSWNYETTRIFKAKGFEVWGVPGVNNWGSLMTRHYVAASNIRNHARALVRYGGSGLLNSDWNEGGYPRLPGTGFHGHVLGAAEAWAPGALGEKEFDRAFALHGLGDPSGKALKAIRVIGKYLNSGPPSEITIPAFLKAPFPSLPGHTAIHVSAGYFDRMVRDIAGVYHSLDRIQAPYLRNVYSLAGRMAWLGARKARLDAAYYGVGTRISRTAMKREAAALSDDLRAGIKQLRVAWPLAATTDGFKPTVQLLASIARSLEPGRFASALARRRPGAVSSVSIEIPRRGHTGPVELNKFHHLYHICHNVHRHTMRARLNYDEQALYVELIGSEPDMPKYKSDAFLMNAMGLGSYFEIFLAPVPDRPFTYAHLGITVTGRIIRRMGAPFTGLSISRKITGNEFRVSVRIPWKGLGCRPGRGQAWRGNFTYSILGNSEFLSWACLERCFLEPQNFGRLLFA